MAKKFTPPEVEALRQEWRRKNPREAEKRYLKKNPPAKERLPDENIIDAVPISELSDTELSKVKKEMTDLWRTMYDRRHDWLQHHDLDEVAMSDSEKEQFREYILRYEGLEECSTETENLLIEGLKYPEKKADISAFCFKYLDAKYDTEKPSSTLWLGIWSRNFVPLDAVRLMIRHDNNSGKYSCRECFKDVWPLIENKVLNHLERERQLKNSRAVVRKVFLEHLVYLFGE